MRKLLNKGLEATADLFEVVRPLFQRLHQVAHVFTNQEQQTASEVQEAFRRQLTQIREQAHQSDAQRSALLLFLKVTESYAPHLFFCYQIPDLPKTNNGLEQTFGKVRAGERRATGRRGAIPGMVVRGPVRLTAALATRLHLFTPLELVPSDVSAWQLLRGQISSRQEARRKQFRFRKDPAAYLAGLEQRLSEASLRS